MSRGRRLPPGATVIALGGSEWQRKGATLSDKTARQEYGLTQQEIVRAIRAGALQFREGSIYGNPFLRLLRREVEELVAKRRGRGHLEQRRATTELARIDREVKKLRARIATLEARRSELASGTNARSPASGPP